MSLFFSLITFKAAGPCQVSATWCPHHHNLLYPAETISRVLDKYVRGIHVHIRTALAHWHSLTPDKEWTRRWTCYNWPPEMGLYVDEEKTQFNHGHVLNPYMIHIKMYRLDSSMHSIFIFERRLYRLFISHSNPFLFTLFWSPGHSVSRDSCWVSEYIWKGQIAGWKYTPQKTEQGDGESERKTWAPVSN